MGQKVHPIGMRLGISKDWLSKWFSNSSEFPNNVYQDFLIRKHLSERLKDAATSKIQIERSSEKTTITINSARPGIVIGKKGEGIEGLRLELAKLMNTTINNIHLNIKEIRKPELDASQIPFSVINPVTYLAGVTSKAKFIALLFFG